MSAEMASLATVAMLAVVHYCAGTKAALRHEWRPQVLSAAAGIGVTYVFLELLPDLSDQHDLEHPPKRAPGHRSHN